MLHHIFFLFPFHKYYNRTQDDDQAEGVGLRGVRERDKEIKNARFETGKPTLNKRGEISCSEGEFGGGCCVVLSIKKKIQKKKILLLFTSTS